MFKHILIAIDGSGPAAKAASHGLELAKQLSADVTVVTVTEPWRETYPVVPGSWSEHYERAAAENAGSALTSATQLASARQVRCATVHVKDRRAAEGIIETAKVRGCDVIVMGSHGRRGVGRLLLGSVAAEVVALSTVPVLVCRQADDGVTSTAKSSAGVARVLKGDRL